MAGGKLTIKQEKYVQGLFAGLSQREAYKQAYNCENMTDKTIDENACKSANDTKIVTRLKELTDELKERNMVTVEKVLSELSLIGFANTTDFVAIEEREYIAGYETDEDGKEDLTKPIMRTGKGVVIHATNEIPDNKVKALAGIKQGANGIEIKLHDKVKALELMGKYLGMFTDKIDIGNKDNKPFEVITAEDKQLLERVAKRLDKNET
jgi:phage terminase small subunit